MESTKTRSVTQSASSKGGKSELFPYEDLIAFATGELDSTALATVESHVSCCTVCAREVERLQADRAKPHYSYIF